MTKCVICLKDDNLPLVCLREKGSKGINDAAQKRGDKLFTESGQYVHSKCREVYINEFNINKAATKKSVTNECASTQPLTRSKEQFMFTTQCLFCGQTAKKDKKRSIEVYPFRTNDFQSNILLICDERRDDWSTEVRGRIECINDLHAADALYHQSCSVNFRTKKAKPQTFVPETDRASKKGRPNNTEDYFQHIVSFLKEHEDEQVTITELVEEMKKLCGNEAYTSVYMKKSLRITSKMAL
jgi:hypothetical protein